MMKGHSRPSQSAPGDFYVESECCLGCGVPQAVAPDLIGWAKDAYEHCYWKKQPETESELQQAFRIFADQELGCHRYAGSDPEIQKRVGRDSCDALQGDYDLIATWEAQASTKWDNESLLTQLWRRLFRRR